MIQDNTHINKASISKPWLKFFEGIDIPEVPRRTIYDTIVDACTKFSDKTAIEYFNTKITYKQLLEEINKTADAYIAAGVKPGDCVSLCLLSMPESTYSLYALAKIGAISRFIDPRSNPKRILRFANDINSRILVMVDVYIDKLETIKNDLNADKIVIASMSESMSGMDKLSFRASVKGRDIIRKSKRFSGILWDDFIAEGVTAESYTEPYSPGAVASIAFTGGTTGLPKGAFITHDTFNTLYIDTYVCCPHMITSESFLGIMPPFASYGLVYGQFMPFVMGLRCRFIPNFVASNFDKLVLKYKPGCVFGVPSHFETLTNSPHLGHKSLDFLKCIVTGGDTFNAATETAINAVLKSHGCRTTVSKGYGMTEMGSAFSFSFANNPMAAPPGSAGIPLCFNTMMIVDEVTGEELDYNCPGEICLSGPTITKGYVNDPEATRDLLKIHPDGTTWIHSGDIGYITEDGVLFVIDRKKRMIIRPDCHKVWPSLIEQTLLQHPAVAQCCAIGLPTPESDTGRIPTAVIVLNEGFSPSDELADDLTHFSLAYLPEREIAFGYRFVDSLPITSIGKVDYRALERKYSA